MLSRRRFLTIAAAAGGSALASRSASAPLPTLRVWTGSAIGARATIKIVHPDAAFARGLIARCTAEIERLEAIFSLYQPDSAICRLNRDGSLREPPVELVEVLAFSLALARQSDGAFDPTVQPLFQLYQAHFADPHADRAGPRPERIAEVLQLVGYRNVRVGPEGIALGREDMAVTLNGVAQGYITDRIAELLRREGLTDLLLDIGEIRAHGRRPDGGLWRAGIADPQGAEAPLMALTVSDETGALPALATSGGYGTRFDAEGKHHHLFDPKTGRSAQHYASVSVLAERALVADAVSTALSVAPRELAGPILAHQRPARAFFISAEGTVAEIAAA